MRNQRVIKRKYVACVLALAFALASCAQESAPAPTFDEEKIVREGIAQTLDEVEYGFDYEIEDASVSGDTASAKVKISTTDVNKVAEGVSANAQEADAAEEIARRYFDEEDVVAYLQHIVDTNMANTAEKVETEVTLHLSKQNDEWTLDQESIDALANAIVGTL